jgi:hypothetical protein
MDFAALLAPPKQALVEDAAVVPPKGIAAAEAPPKQTAFADAGRAPAKGGVQDEAQGPADREAPTFHARRGQSATARPGARGGSPSKAGPSAAATARRQAVMTARREAEERVARNRERAQREAQRKAQARRAAEERAARVRAQAAAQAAAAHAKHTASTASSSSSGGGVGCNASAPGVVPTIHTGATEAARRLAYPPPPPPPPPVRKKKPKPKPAELPKAGPLGGLSLSLSLPVKDEPKGFQQWQEWQSGPVAKPRAANTEVDKDHVPKPTWKIQAPPPLASLASLAQKAKGDKPSGSGADVLESPQELAALLGEDGCGGDPDMAYDVLCQLRTHCFDGAQRELTKPKVLPAIVSAMGAHLGSEGVQVVACEVFALLAGSNECLEGSVFDAGALGACIAACRAFPDSEDVLGTAFEAIGVITRSEEDDILEKGLNPYGDRTAWARKQAAVDQGALEVLTAGMTRMARFGGATWVRDAGMVTISGLTKGRDEKGHARRQRARALLRQSLHGGIGG